MSKDYSSLFISDKVKTFFKLGKEYDGIIVGIKKELPAKVMFDAMLAERKLKELSKQKDNEKKQIGINNVMQSLYQLSIEYLKSVFDEENNRVIPDEIIKQLGLEEAISHFRNIRNYQSASVEERIKK